MKKELLYMRVYQDLKGMISRGEYAAGSKIPTEIELQELCGVGRVTIQKAMELLAADGLIVRRQGQGTFVSSREGGAAGRAQSGALAGALAGSAEGRGNSIGVIMSSMSVSFGRLFLESVALEARRRKLGVELGLAYATEEEEQDILDFQLRNGVKGFIIMPLYGSSVNFGIIDTFRKGVPIVFADRYIEGIPAPYVGSNNEQGAFEATQHLLSLGHTRIGFISPQPTITTISERRQGYFRAFAMTENKVHPSEMMHDILSDMPGMDNSLNFREDIERMKRYLSEQRDVTALLCTDYSVMKICETAARELGIRIPGELSVVCFDVPHDRFSRESYTHVAQKEDTLGRTAVELLCDVLEGKPAPQRILLDTELRIASSTARREAPRPSATA